MLILVLGASILIGYYISDRVPGELPIGEKWFLVATALFALPLFWFLKWWAAALVMGSLLLGWFPALIGYGSVMHASPLVEVEVLIVLGLLVGTRWRVEERPFPQLLVATLIITALSLLTAYL